MLMMALPGRQRGHGFSDADRSVDCCKRYVMADMLARNWWVLVLRGAAALIFGVLAFLWPHIALIALVLLFGAYVLVDGIFNLINAALGRTREPRWIVAVM